MTDKQGLLLSDAREMLLGQVRRMAGGADMMEAFAAWALPDRAQELGISLSTIAAAENLKRSGRTYRDVAQVGFGLAASPHAFEALRDDFSDGLDWLLGRPVIAGGSFAQFCYDAIAILGIALGVRSLADVAVVGRVANWLGGFVPEVVATFKGASWGKFLLLSAHAIVDDSVSLPSAEPGDADIVVALVARGAATHKDIVDRETEEHALLRIKQAHDEDDERVVLLLSALDFISRLPVSIDFERPTIAHVGRFLERVPSALRRWTWEHAAKTRNSDAVCWDVQNEYHVQNLLYALLAPIFPDLTDEETLPPVGQKNPRADLGIPSLKLIVEAKFLRPGHSFANLIGELGQDASLYLAHEANGRYQYVLPFIWDDSRRTEEHAKFLQGLGQIAGIVHPVIVPRPGQMERKGK
ncbi:hypothetical protein [Burkholderia pseudomallei]|uniref:PD-(D/E)XK nuclease domain-containing protein n=1 Tax=Burkholderia pseudomallei TaxID=28450 RepID=UPI00100C09AC|nr:hypothetical protein [Burkholderia pseudomallei]